MEFRAAIVGQRRHSLTLGELAYAFDQEADSSYDELRAVLQADGVDAPHKSTLSRFKRVHEVLVLSYQLPTERLELVDDSKLYAIAAHTSETGDDPHPWLDKAHSVTREELQAAMAGEQPAAAWSWPKDKQVTADFDTGARRLYESVGQPAHGRTPAVEMAGLMFRELPIETLRQLWAEAHGEGCE